MSNTPTSFTSGREDRSHKDYTVFYRVIEERCAVVRAASPIEARYQVELYLDACRPVPASIHVDTQSVITGVRDCSVAIDTTGSKITEDDLPY